MIPDQQALVDRVPPLLTHGHRVLAAAPADPAWRVVTGEARLGLTPSADGGRVLERGVATLRLQVVRPTRFLAIEVPEARVDRADAGGELPFADWRVTTLTVDGGPARWSAVAEDPAATVAGRPGHRLVLVELPEAPHAGAPVAVALSWEQTLPWATHDMLSTQVLVNDPATPLHAALPRLAGDHAPFPYTLAVDAPPGATVVASGRADAPVPGDPVARSHGDVGGAAVVAVGAWRVADLGGVRVAAPGATRSAALAVNAVAAPLAAWAGTPLGEMDFVQLPASFRPPAGAWGEGVAGIRPWRVMDQEVRTKPLTGPVQLPPSLPAIPTVLGGESLAAAAWAGRGGADAAGDVWLEAFGRAFALEVLDPGDARAWRTWLQQCATPLPTMNPALSPHAAATTAFRDVAARCAGPMILGPMLDDRVGAAAARRVRRSALAGPVVDLEALRAAVLAESPSAASWVDRWLGAGQPVRLDVTWELTRAAEGGGAVVRGAVHADSALAGAPVRLRFRRGPRVFDVQVRGEGAVVSFTADLPFVPLALEVDPDRRLLRVPGVPGDPPRRRGGRLRRRVSHGQAPGPPVGVSGAAG